MSKPIDGANVCQWILNYIAFDPSVSNTKTANVAVVWLTPI